MQVNISVCAPCDARSSILAIEAAAKAICEHAGIDGTDAARLIMAAAVHMARRDMDASVKDVCEALAFWLGDAIVAADDLFQYRQV